MDAIERVEVAIRAALIHELAMRGWPFAHIDIKNFPYAKPKQHARFLEALEVRRAHCLGEPMPLAAPPQAVST